MAATRRRRDHGRPDRSRRDPGEDRARGVLTSVPGIGQLGRRPEEELVMRGRVTVVILLGAAAALAAAGCVPAARPTPSLAPTFYPARSSGASATRATSRGTPRGAR